MVILVVISDISVIEQSCNYSDCLREFNNTHKGTMNFEVRVCDAALFKSQSDTLLQWNTVITSQVRHLVEKL